MKSNYKIFIFYAVLIVGLFVVASAVLGNIGKGQELDNYSQVVQMFKGEEVKAFTVDDTNTLHIKSQDDKVYTYALRDISIFYNDLSELIEQQRASGLIEEYEYEAPTVLPWWVSFVPYIIMIVLLVALWIHFTNQMTGKGGKINAFGKAKVKVGADEKKKVFFTDVAGADEEKEELREVVEYLKDPGKYTRLGARIPRGVLLVGPPGTGKTLLAKAVAGEAGVPFYSISGSDFVEMYVGVGASRVRDLFDTARKNPASIIFIDEIDAVGRHRGAGLGGGHDEREQTLNQLLVEMDGFGTHEGVIVMAATNRPDILDPALLRPGRFDRQITVHYPDIKGREEILKVHSRGKPISNDVDLSQVAKTTVGFTGADLANLLNEAALLAARKGKSVICMPDIDEAAMKLIVGTPKRNKKRKEIDVKVAAYHEAGHAISRYFMDKLDPVTQISIIPTAMTGGYTLSVPQEDKMVSTRGEMQQEIITLLGGRVAEMIIFNDLSTGASNDIQRATQTATDMVTKYGMSDLLGSVVYGSSHGNDEVFLGRDFSNTKTYSDKTAAEIDGEIRRIIDKAYNTCMEIIKANMDKLHFISEYLIKNEVMDADQFKAVMEGNPTAEELDEMVAEKRRKEEEENELRRKAEEEARKKDEEARKKREQEQKNTNNKGDKPPRPF